MIYLSVNGYPIKADSEENFYCSNENAWILNYMTDISVDVNRTIYTRGFSPDVTVLSMDDFIEIIHAEYAHEIYSIKFEFPDEETELYFKLKFCV